ncbi:efflux RND transporter periplasmic adaptor subunit [Methylobacterium nodulans]|uniref:Efflux transporter, RND family, MFP subunit n=1 Tax=Methylobacterium nodulans (strain LMG 21967 / CNCM I-2342 / ORS 2060) TaxID=460265 RepID=B8IXH5_METNO|nr:efflux RND transporter periplasmic adaptor subunit [Methylobacterium nodulans]ACL63216.1 efflux transporter, RND family, MFP subunit [Methylobacterium nodulans ORS 2060]
MRRTSRILLGLAVATPGALLLAGTGGAPARPDPDQPVKPLAVETSRVSDTPLGRGVTAVASLRAVQQVTLSPEVDGRVVAIHFQEGARVEAGAPILDLFRDPQQAELNRSRAEETLARLQLDRARALLQREATAQAEVDRRQAGLDQAVAQRQAAEAALAQRVVRAPFAGELGLRRTDPGHYLRAGDPIVTLTALDALYVDFAVPQRYLADLREGQAVEVASDAAGGRTVLARLDTIEPQIDPGTRNIRLRARLDNRDRSLRPGASVTATLRFAPERGVVTVPETAIVASAATDTAFVVRDLDADGHGHVAQVSVTTGRRSEGRIVVSAGLEPGEVVVTAGQLRLSPGQPVRLEARHAASAAPEPALR